MVGTISARLAGRLRRGGLLLGAAALAATILTACGGGSTGGVGTPTTTPGVLLSTEQSPVGRVLATGTGYTLYDFSADTPDSSACTSSACTFLWPPVLATAPATVAKGLSQSLVGEIRRPDGALQVTYGGHPLYRWTSDTRPGMITGQALLNEGGYWYVVSPSGRQITTPFTVE